MKMSDLSSEGQGNWLDKYEILKPVMTLYFLIIYQPHSPLEYKYLSMAQAIETYHRRTYGGQFQEKKVYRNGIYKVLSSVIPEDLNSDFSESLKSRIRYGYEYSFKKRLRNLLQYITENLQCKNHDEFEFIYNQEIREAFIQSIGDNRNYFTHYDEELLPKVAARLNLYHLFVKLQLLLEICLLKELGFSFDSISSLIVKSDRFFYLSSIKPI